MTPFGDKYSESSTVGRKGVGALPPNLFYWPPFTLAIDVKNAPFSATIVSENIMTQSKFKKVVAKSFRNSLLLQSYCFNRKNCIEIEDSCFQEMKV